MKKGWTYKKLGEVCDLYQPKTISTKEMVADGKYDVFGANGVIGKYNQYNHEQSEVLMTCRGATCGNINVSTPKSWINGNAMVIHIKDNSILIKPYLVYALSHIDKSHIITGAAQPQITRQTLSPLCLSYPSISEQQRIVSRLDAAFAHIDELKANAEKQLSEARALFQKALSKAMEPKEGWEEKTLKDICKVINGRAYAKDEMLNKGKYRLLRVGNFFTNDKWYYSDLELEDDKYCDNGDLLYAWSASFGPKIWKGEKVIYHYHIWKMLCSSEVDKYFMFYWLDSDELKKQTMSNLHGATMAHITKGIIEASKVTIPPLSEQRRIVARLDSLSAHVRELEEISKKTIAECDALKQALLRKVFE